MSESSYRRCAAYFDQHSGMRRTALVLNQLMTAVAYIAYPVLLLVLLFLRKDAAVFWHALLVPAVAFLCVTLLRDRLNRPRPYEVFQTAPTLRKQTKGRSFPSRHAFSIFMISLTFFYAGYAGLGTAMTLMSVLLAFLRVVLGVHFPRDVLAGAALAALAAAVGYLLL